MKLSQKLVFFRIKIKFFFELLVNAFWASDITLAVKKVKEFREFFQEW